MNINRIVLLVLLIPPFYYVKTHFSKTRMTADGRQRLCTKKNNKQVTWQVMWMHRFSPCECVKCTALKSIDIILPRNCYNRVESASFVILKSLTGMYQWCKDKPAGAACGAALQMINKICRVTWQVWRRRGGKGPFTLPTWGVGNLLIRGHWAEPGGTALTSTELPWTSFSPMRLSFPSPWQSLFPRPQSLAMGSPRGLCIITPTQWWDPIRPWQSHERSRGSGMTLFSSRVDTNCFCANLSPSLHSSAGPYGTMLWSMWSGRTGILPSVPVLVLLGSRT